MDQNSEYRQFSPFRVDKTTKSPGIQYNPNTNIISITGISVPEDHASFYNPIIAWFEAFVQSPPDHTTVIVQMEYFNTSSSKYFLRIFKMLQGILDKGKRVEAVWIYEEDDWDMRECGNDYQSLVSIPFSLKAVKE